MKVSVLGAGAIGAMLGGLLQHDAPELEVQLIARGEHRRLIAERGTLLLDGPWGTREVKIRASDDLADIAGSQYVFVTVKSQDTEEAARAARSHWADATVVSVQNGINDLRLAPYVGAGQLVMGMTATNMTVVEPGRVSLQLGGATVLGPRVGAAGDCERVKAAVGLLSRIRCPELNFSTHKNVLGVRYNKLAINAVGYASCLSASNFIGEALADGRSRAEVGLPIVHECRQLFSRAGIKLAKIPGVPSLPSMERLMRWVGAPVVGPALTVAVRRMFSRKQIVLSLLQDLRRRVATEVDYINGEIVHLAEVHGTQARANTLVVEMVREIEQRGDGSFFTLEQVVDRFSALPR